MNLFSGYELMLIRVGDIQIDHSYQREPNEALVREIAENFKEEAFGVLQVNIRKPEDGGGMFAMDGQHRKLGFTRRFDENGLVLCLVQRGLTVAQEALVFMMLNRNRKPVNIRDFWKNLLAQNEPVVTTIQRVCDDLGITILKRGKSARTNVNAVKHLMFAGTIGGEEWVRGIMTTLLDSYSSTDKRLGNEMIHGMYLFFNHAKGNFDRDSLVNTLRKRGFASIQKELDRRRETAHASPGIACFEVLCDWYNARRTASRLPDPPARKRKSRER